MGASARVPVSAPLTARLRDATDAAHRAAETRPFIGQLLQGTLPRERYVRLLANLHALYAALEGALARAAAGVPLAPFAAPALAREGALARDLDALAGPGWRAAPLAAAMRDYVARVDELARDAPLLLAAHAYVRYLGDLSGGQAVGRAVRRAYALDAATGSAFYAFDEDPAVLKARVRAALDALPAAAGDAIVAEAVAAFARHMALFDELAREG